jgi:hypothetical protein
MDRVAVTFAKLAAVLKSARALIADATVRYVDPRAALGYFEQSTRLFGQLKADLPELFALPRSSC